MATPNLPPGFDFTDPDIYAHRLPVQEFAELRATEPIWWNEQPLDQGGFGDGGYWVVTKHRDIREVSLRSDVFSSATKSIVPRYRGDLAQGQIEAGRASMIMMDDPEHSRLRKIVYWSAFVPAAGTPLYDEVPPPYQQLFDAQATASGNNSVAMPLEVCETCNCSVWPA